MTTLQDVIERMKPKTKECFYFPLDGNPLYAHFKQTDVIGWRNFPTFRAARQMAFEFYEKVIGDPPEYKTYLILRANGLVALWRFGPRGSHKQLWNFGDPFAPKLAKP